MRNLTQDIHSKNMGRGIMNLNNMCVRVLVFYLMKGETQQGRKFSVSSGFS